MSIQAYSILVLTGAVALATASPLALGALQLRRRLLIEPMQRARVESRNFDLRIQTIEDAKINLA